MRTAVRAHLANFEDRYVADEAVEEFETGGRVGRPVAELVAELGINAADIAEGEALVGNHTDQWR